MLDKNKLRILLQALGSNSQRIIDTYRTSSANYITRMKIAFANGDTNELAHIAHTLKGSSITLAATNLSEKCHLLEQAIYKNNLDNISVLLSHIETIRDHTVEELMKFEKSQNIK
ncbi:MAG: Hpt domain-containing protein [Gammaproteobacteria bacterium]|nr:Hpt domain-containing protein [Gammaproteobacteria bacterium]